MSDYFDDYEDGNENRSISGKIACEVGIAVEAMVGKLLPVETKALEAKLEEKEQELTTTVIEFYKMERANKQLERDSGKPYEEQNEEIRRLNSHVANLQAAKVENEELRDALHRYQKDALCLGMAHKEEREKLTRCYTDARRAYEGLRDENVRLLEEVQEARTGYTDKRLAAHLRTIRKLEEQNQKLEKQISEAMTLENRRNDLWYVLNEKQIEIRHLKTRLSNCAHWSTYGVVPNIWDAIELIRKEAQDAK